MIIVMLVSLYTSRVVLHALGSEDFGINNVVGGVVTMLSFMSNTMMHSAQRFFSIELGRSNYGKLKKLFKVNITLYLIIGLISLLLGETIGIWLMHNYMTIPQDRMIASEWVLHFAVLSFCLSILVLPYKSAIMARENMSIMAYLSIIEVVAKLGLVYLLVLSPIDKLIAFVFLNFIVHVIINISYILVARHKYEECRFGLSKDFTLFREVLGFTGWSFLGHFATMMRSQGLNVVLNVYCGPIVNAARAIAFQVNGAISNLSQNFYMAVKPQIIKYYSIKDKNEMFSLVIRSSKLCFFLVYILSLPVFIETDYILSLWLTEVPEFTNYFVKIVLLNTLIESYLMGLTTSIDATGDIKKYQIVLSAILLLSFVLGWLSLAKGFPPYYPMIIIVFLPVVRLFVQLIFTKIQLNFSIRLFTNEVLTPSLFVAFLSAIIPIVIYLYLPTGIYRFIIVLFFSFTNSIIFMWLFGLKKNEKIAFQNYFHSFVKQYR